MVSENLFCIVSLLISHQVTKYTKNVGSDLFEKINKSVLSHIKLYLQDGDHKHVDFNEETISFTCQLIKK